MRIFGYHSVAEGNPHAALTENCPQLQRQEVKRSTGGGGVSRAKQESHTTAATLNKIAYTTYELGVSIRVLKQPTGINKK